MFKHAFLIASILAPFTSHATSLLTEAEAKQVKQVRAQYSNTTELKELAKVNSSIFTLSSQTEKLKSTILREKQLYQEYQQKLSNEMLSGTEEKTDFYFDAMKKASKRIKQSQKQIQHNQKQLKHHNEKIALLNEALRESKEIYNNKLSSLKDNVVNRLKKEFSNPLPMTIAGKIKCSPYQSIRACFENKQTTSKLINKAIEDHFGQLSITSSNNNFQVKSALMDYDGNVDYRANFNLFVQYNENIEAQIIKEIGVESFSIHLLSNKAASFYVDGLPVGTGSDISVKLAKGKYAILARFDGHQESTIQDISTPVRLTYNF
ncbi:hypothetical protein C942_03566 [Photobacterium marinum]|uniref:PEGA domain-containing protein n=1 Tax=Photobacterium marinum TaxID=1056511 RepID=L8J3V6_9GAMM|nr:hypothetical protein [Photobacterium marinum]ELR63550.1 hypothetical protein C942_03566 [Photobacterium marinum]